MKGDEISTSMATGSLVKKSREDYKHQLKVSPTSHLALSGEGSKGKQQHEKRKIV